jgi:hypothetical protein
MPFSHINIWKTSVFLSGLFVRHHLIGCIPGYRHKVSNRIIYEFKMGLYVNFKDIAILLMWPFSMAVIIANLIAGRFLFTEC